ncbi:uncharacterized protein BDV14DRAFT_205752 [Aspergillus stella-maris]|uniref:uncharacterized protein n=1 Tax=Aspergillus stella-maris TaxID=1810926 RepID=UPI003CCD957D
MYIPRDDRKLMLPRDSLEEWRDGHRNTDWSGTNIWLPIVATIGAVLGIIAVALIVMCATYYGERVYKVFKEDGFAGVCRAGKRKWHQWRQRRYQRRQQRDEEELRELVAPRVTEPAPAHVRSDRVPFDQEEFDRRWRRAVGQRSVEDIGFRALSGKSEA